MKKSLVIMLLLTVSTLIWAGLPSFQLKDINGNTVDSGSLTNNGKPIVVSFFTTWCKPCMRELAAINDAYPDWQDELGVKVVLISVDQAQDVQKVKPLLDGNAWDFDCLLDPNGDLQRALAIQSIPYSMVLDAKGEIVYKHVGYTDGDEDELYKFLKGL